MGNWARVKVACPDNGPMWLVLQWHYCANQVAKHAHNHILFGRRLKMFVTRRTPEVLNTNSSASLREITLAPS